jgi:lysosomal Pro-X carboxypeptidase
MPVDQDHFSWVNDETFQIRYFTFDGYWGGPGSPIWFYAGNEANVEKYVNATGLMWENAKSASALLVFAEHRFFGDSWPCGSEEAAVSSCLHLLTHEQAMADYVQLLAALKETVGAEASPVIAFGGSYGGMLAAWLRAKYPATFAGAIAASGNSSLNSIP